MSYDAIEMHVFAARVSRPPFWPATTDTWPTPPQLPNPPRDDRPTVDELCARARQTVTDLHAAIARSRRARGADIELPEVA